MNAPGPYDSVVLAGQRGGSTPLSALAEVAVDILVPVGGRPAIDRVLGALQQCALVRPSVVVGPTRSVLDGCPQLRDVYSRHGVTWLAPLGDPASSAMVGIDALEPPLLLTTGDHALLTAQLVDEFCTAAAAAGGNPDVVVGLVPYQAVKRAYPESRRTVLRFADGGVCGTNLYFVRTSEARRVFEFWRDLQHDRKRPHRMARRIGWRVLLRYLAGRLTLAEAMARLSTRAGCRVGAVRLEEPSAAVDVDSVADWRLAERIVRGGP